MQQRILLFGAAGQVGSALVPALSTIGEVVAVTRQQCDLCDDEAVKALVRQISPQIIVNAAAYTAVDMAETEAEQAQAVNGNFPKLLAQLCEEAGIFLVDYSTDYIYDGSKHTPWEEGDVRSPINAYGRSKRNGLLSIERSGCRYLVFVVSWVYAATGHNFPQTILRLAREKQEISVVYDQLGAPTPADWIAETTVTCLKQALESPGKCGTYHMAPAGSTSWHGFAVEIVKLANERGVSLALEPDNIKAVPTSAYPTAAQRPVNSMLSTRKLQETFGVTAPHWRSLFRRENFLIIE